MSAATGERAYRAYPWHALPAFTIEDARLLTALARLGASTTPPTWGCIRRLLRVEGEGPVSIAMFRDRSTSPFDPHAACCEVRVSDVALRVLGSSTGVRAIAQRVLGGPAELAAPRALDDVESSIWTLVVATLLEDLGIAGHVWPSGRAKTATRGGDATVVGELVLGDIRVAVAVEVPHAVVSRTALARPVPSRAWLDRIVFELPVVVGRCALHRDDVARLGVRSVVTLERPASGSTWDLDVFGGVVGLADRTAGQGAHAVVTTGYGLRDMSLPDDAHVELTVTVGTSQLSLRQVTELAVGQIVQLHRPLGGLFELRAAGRILGQAELVDVDGELAVRIVSLGS